MTTEPVAVQAAIAAAINVTLGLLSFFGINNELVGALQIVAGAWITVIFTFVVRAKVTPNARVALTVQDVQDLEDAGFQRGNQVP